MNYESSARLYRVFALAKPRPKPLGGIPLKMLRLPAILVQSQSVQTRAHFSHFGLASLLL